MYNKKANAGTLFRGNTGKLTVGLHVYDIAMVKNTNTAENSPAFDLIQYSKTNKGFRKTLCGLWQFSTTNKIYYQGDISIGFGVMRVQIWKNEQMKSEKSPTMYITAQLLSDTGNRDSSSQKENFGDADIAEQAFGTPNYNQQQSYNQRQSSHNTELPKSVYGGIEIQEEEIPF